ncbi:hypothetical protein [Sorangium cellulosum]|uniref:hypothetical protein n=1 Tax=Sorangium cellulosum TaxID=56 RepID=UPI0012FFC618|nr:hypothetical protein [Sorangium cellulosum]
MKNVEMFFIPPCGQGVRRWQNGARAPAQTTIDDLRAGFRLQGLTSWKAIVVSSR